MNPLLDFSGLPRFSEFNPDQVTPAVDQLLADCRATVARVLSDSTDSDWDSFVTPLDDANERLSRAWGQVSHLHSVMDSPELREAYNENLPKITVYFAELGQNTALFAKFKALKARPDYEALSAPRKKIVENELRDFRLGGAELPDDQKNRFMQLQEEMAQCGAKFEENLLDATNAYSLFIDDIKALAGVPDDALAAMQAAAQADDKPGWKITLQMPSYLPVMQYASNRELREQLYRAYVTRASEFGPPELDNTALITDILKLRREAAQMLGFNSYAEVSLAAKMADTPSEVLHFLDQLAARAKPYAEKDMAELRAFARELDIGDLQSWDHAYVSEKLRVARYSFSDQEVKQYFPEPRVLAGLF